MGTRVKLKEPGLLSNQTWSMLKLIDPLKVYACQTKFEHFRNWVMLEGWDTWLDAEMFDVIEDEPEPKILTGKVETKEEIEERIGASGRDPLALSVKEIMELQEAYHAVIKSTAQLVEINKMLLPMIDEVLDDISKGKSCGTLHKIRTIRKFVEAGSHS